MPEHSEPLSLNVIQFKKQLWNSNSLWICSELGLIVLTRKPETWGTGISSELGRCHCPNPSLFPDDGVVGHEVMTDSLGQSRERNEYLMLSRSVLLPWAWVFRRRDLRAAWSRRTRGKMFSWWRSLNFRSSKSESRIKLHFAFFGLQDRQGSRKHQV